MLVRRDERDRYIDALRQADAGDLQPLVLYFGDVEQALLRRAISEAEGAIDAHGGLQSVLAAATKKRARRAETAASERKVLCTRLAALVGEAKRELEATGEQIRVQVHGIEVRPVRRADTATRRYFRTS